MRLKKLRLSSVHSVTVVLIIILPQQLCMSVGMENSYCRMADAVEHASLYGCVVYHIFEDYVFTGNKGMVKLPVAHEVSAETAVAAEPIGERL